MKQKAAVIAVKPFFAYLMRYQIWMGVFSVAGVEAANCITTATRSGQSRNMQNNQCTGESHRHLRTQIQFIIICYTVFVTGKKTRTNIFLVQLAILRPLA